MGKNTVGKENTEQPVQRTWGTKQALEKVARATVWEVTLVPYQVGPHGLWCYSWENREALEGFVQRSSTCALQESIWLLFETPGGCEWWLEAGRPIRECYNERWWWLGPKWNEGKWGASSPFRTHFKVYVHRLLMNVSTHCYRKRNVKDDTTPLSWAMGRMEWPMPEMEKTI